MSCDNPLNIPFEKLSELQGTLKFKLQRNNLFEALRQYVCLFSVGLGKSSFALFRDNKLNLIFVHATPETSTRTAVINLYGLSADFTVHVPRPVPRTNSHVYLRHVYPLRVGTLSTSFKKIKRAPCTPCRESSFTPAGQQFFCTSRSIPARGRHRLPQNR